MNKKTIFISGLFLAAVLLRCLFIDSRGIWYDDAFSILLSRQDLSRIVSGTAADTMPPLYYFLLHFWSQIGAEIWWYRLLGILLSLGSLIFLFLLMKEISGYKAAIWALILGIFSPFQIYHAQEIRMYALLELTQVAYIYFFYKLVQSPKPTWLTWVGFILSGTLSMYTHNLAVFFLPVPDLILLIRRQWKMFPGLILAQAVIVGLFIPWLIYVPGQIQKIQTAFWTPKPGFLELVQSGVDLLGSLYSSGRFLIIASAISLILSLFILIAFFRMKTISPMLKITFGVLVFMLPFELFIFSYIMRPIYVTRGFITSILLFGGLAGLVLSGIENFTPRILLGLSAVVLAIIVLPSQYHYAKFPRSPFSEAIQETSNRIGEYEIILHDNKLSYLPSHIYFPDIPQIFLADQPATSNDTFAVESQMAMGVSAEKSIEQAANGYQGIYFVVFSKTLENYQELGVDTHPVLAWLDTHYLFIDQTRFNDLLIYKYSK